jgi:hypothetical protein
MPVASVLPPAITATSSSGTHLELGAILVVALIFVALLLVRAKQHRDQRVRKAASEGYFDLDVARYVHAPIPDPPAAESTGGPDRPLAPSFVAPTRAKVAKRGAPVPPARPVSAFGAKAEAGAPPTPLPVPAFDQAAAVSARPPASTTAVPPTSPPLPPPPTPGGGSVAPLPRMDQPLPQPRTDPPRH